MRFGGRAPPLREAAAASLSPAVGLGGSAPAIGPLARRSAPASVDCSAMHAISNRIGSFRFDGHVAAWAAWRRDDMHFCAIVSRLDGHIRIDARRRMYDAVVVIAVLIQVLVLRLSRAAGPRLDRFDLFGYLGAAVRRWRGGRHWRGLRRDCGCGTDAHRNNARRDDSDMGLLNMHSAS